jgi:hypothetical protein
MTAEKAQAAALADFLAGKVGKEFTAKLLERGISDRDVERVLKSHSSGVCQYVHEGQPRYGFYHPDSGVFVSWQPAEGGFTSEIKTAMRPRIGFQYVLDIEGVVIIRRPRGE